MTRWAFLASVFLTCAGTAAYHRIPVDTYNNFLVNWDSAKQPVLYALVRTDAEYKTLFHPAATNFSRGPYAPDADLYRTESILVVGRVLPLPPDMDKVFDVQSIAPNGDELTLRYSFHDPGSNASSSVKDYLAVRIPKHDYKKVVFVENDKTIGELNVAAGQWAVPPVARQ